MLPQVPWFQQFCFICQVLKTAKPLLLSTRKSIHNAAQCQATTLKCWQRPRAFQLQGRWSSCNSPHQCRWWRGSVCVGTQEGGYRLEKPERTSADARSRAAVKLQMLVTHCSHLPPAPDFSFSNPSITVYPVIHTKNCKIGFLCPLPHPSKWKNLNSIPLPWPIPTLPGPRISLDYCWRVFPGFCLTIMNY